MNTFKLMTLHREVTRVSFWPLPGQKLVFAIKALKEKLYYKKTPQKIQE